MEEAGYLGLAAGFGAALLFPILAVIVHARRARSRDRRAGSRRTDKIKL